MEVEDKKSVEDGDITEYSLILRTLLILTELIFHTGISNNMRNYWCLMYKTHFLIIEHTTVILNVTCGILKHDNDVSQLFRAHWSN